MKLNDIEFLNNVQYRRIIKSSGHSTNEFIETKQRIEEKKVQKIMENVKSTVLSY